MPSYWSRDVHINGPAGAPDRRSHCADHRRAPKGLFRLDHDYDSNITEQSAMHPRMDVHYDGNADKMSAGDEITEIQPLDHNNDGENSEGPYPDVKVSQYKVENGRLKDLLRRKTHDLREKCSALSICQTELAEALISQTADDGCVKRRQINKLARDLKDRLYHSEVQMKLLREECDQAALDLTALTGKMTTCTTIAEEQAKLLKGQLNTICKFEKKIQSLEKALQKMRAGQQETVHDFESSIQTMQAQHKELIQDYENSLQDMQMKHKEEIQSFEDRMEDMTDRHMQEIEVLEKRMQDMQAGYNKDGRKALEEQLSLHQKRAVLQDRKIKKYHHELDIVRSELSKGKTREAEMGDQLQTQTLIYQDTTRELWAATKEIEQLNNVSMELREQEERMEQLWVDNARLVQLLAESDEYQNLFHEMQGGKGLVFCPSNVKISRFESLAQRYGAGSGYGRVNPKSEREHWIPAELYDLVIAFRKQHWVGLEMEMVQELLRIVSTFWRERHKKIVHQVKTKHEKQLSDFRRQLSQRLPYGQVVQPSHSRSAKKMAQSNAFKS